MPRPILIGLIAALSALAAAAALSQEFELPRPYVDEDGVEWEVISENRDSFTITRIDEGGFAQQKTIWKIEKPTEWPFPESVLVMPDGEAVVRYVMKPLNYSSLYFSMYATRQVPVFSLDRDGNERQGVWLTTGPDGVYRSMQTLPLELRRVSRAYIDGGPYWELDTGLATLTHLPAGAKLDAKLPESDHVELLLYNMERTMPGVHRGVPQPVFITDNPNGSDCTNFVGASDVFRRVQDRLNSLLSLPGNRAGDTRVVARVCFKPLPKPPGDRLAAKARTLIMFTSDRLISSTPNIGVLNRLDMRNGSPNDDAQDTFETFVYSNLGGANPDRYVRVGPGAFPGTVRQLGSNASDILLPDGLRALASDQTVEVIIEFDTGVTWDFDSDDQITPGTCDFEEVLTHEMVHALGFVSNAGVEPGSPASNWNRLTVMDLMRFDRNDVATFGNLAAGLSGGDDRRPMVAVNSPDPFFALSQQSSDWMPMSRGEQYVPPGDNRGVSHWREPASGQPRIGIMNPTAEPAGTRSPLYPYYLSKRDIWALDLLGWHIDTPAGNDISGLFASAAPAPGVAPIAATGVTLEPTLQWTPPAAGNSEPGADVFLFEGQLNPGGTGDPVFSANDQAGSTADVPAGVLSEGTTYSWITVTENLGVREVSGPYEFTTATDCPADVNGDGLVTPADLNAWIIEFNAQGPLCDQNGDGLCTAADFNAWIINYNAGC